LGEMPQQPRARGDGNNEHDGSCRNQKAEKPQQHFHCSPHPSRYTHRIGSGSATRQPPKLPELDRACPSPSYTPFVVTSLVKVMEVDSPGEFDRPREVMDKLERSVGPEGNKLPELAIDRKGRCPANCNAHAGVANDFA